MEKLKIENGNLEIGNKKMETGKFKLEVEIRRLIKFLQYDSVD